MPIDRYFLNAPLIPQKIVSLEGDEWHHLLRVMRAKKGKEIELINGKGEIAQAVLIGSNNKSALLQIEEVRKEPPPSCFLILAQAIPLPSSLPWIVEKGVELGTTDFWIFPGEKSKSSTLSANQKRRLLQTAISAIKQSGRLYLPSILEKPPLCNWKEPLNGSLYFGNPKSTMPLSLHPHKDVLIFIGPESGFSNNEIHLLEKLQVTGIRLHRNILRTETAAICALSLFSHLQTLYTYS